jgi:hypothetical protein
MLLISNVLDSHVAPALQAAESALRRAQLETVLEKKFDARPERHDLVEHNILKSNH